MTTAVQPQQGHVNPVTQQADTLGPVEIEPVDTGELEPQETPEQRQLAMRKLYGIDFPLASDTMVQQGQEPQGQDWAKWVRTLWDRHGAGVQRRVHLSYRNRLMYRGIQWLSAKGSGPWAEPPRPRDSVRAVHNMVKPAIDMRLQVIMEQRPGFRTKPTNQDPGNLKKAEAQQLALEYSYDEQQMQRVMSEATFWANLDGFCGLYVHWDPEAGPWNEEQGPDGKAWRYPMGDVRCKVYRLDQVRVSAGSTATQKPWYWVVREVIPLADAVAQYGSKVTDEHGENASQLGNILTMTSRMTRLGLDLPGEYELQEDQETVDVFHVFCEPSEFLPDGLQVHVVGAVDTFVGALFGGVCPMVRVTDGSTDPAFFPEAICESWFDHQIRVNMLVSKWVESIRVNSGGRFLTKAGTTSTETLIGGLISAIEVRAAGNLSDAIQPVQGFSVGNDVVKAIDFEIKAFEQKSGWNDASRGSFSSGASGRAILAVREQLERIFTPPVNAMARAMVDWAKITLNLQRWGYDIPRTIGMFGSSRTDLSRQISQDDYDGICNVSIDEESLMPLPRAMRLFLLDQLLDKQVITPQEYRRRQPFAWTRNIESPDDTHEARARRIAEAIRSGQPAPPMRWQDNEAIHQDVLEREIILDDTLPEPIIQQAIQRWTQLAQQAAQKQGGPPPGAPPKGSAPPKGPQLPATQQPLLGTNPGVASAPLKQLAAGSMPANAAAAHDHTTPY